MLVKKDRSSAVVRHSAAKPVMMTFLYEMIVKAHRVQSSEEASRNELIDPSSARTPG
jgi:hypothetical protein